MTSIGIPFSLKPKLTIPISFLTGTLYAVTDEIHQYFVPGRNCQLSDILLDASGVFFGIAFLQIIISIRKCMKTII